MHECEAFPECKQEGDRVGKKAQQLNASQARMKPRVQNPRNTQKCLGGMAACLQFQHQTADTRDPPEKAGLQDIRELQVCLRNSASGSRVEECDRRGLLSTNLGPSRVGILRRV